MVDPTFVSVTAKVRKLARARSTAQFSDPEIVHEQESAYAVIIIKTGKSNWSTADNRFPAIQKIEERLAAAYVVEHYGLGTPEELNWIQFWTTQANADLDTLAEESIDTEQDLNVIVDSSDYLSYPASLQDNSNALPYRSTTVVP